MTALLSKCYTENHSETVHFHIESILSIMTVLDSSNDDGEIKLFV